MALSPGTRLGSYEIVDAIGAGGMGEVYRARDTKLGRDVAIKVLPASLTNDPDRLLRFTREAQVLAALSHPNIAAIYHVEDAERSPAIVMELVEGETLAERIGRGPIPLDEALPIAKQIAEALEAAHEQGIIHRDLKPANVKIKDDGTVKVLDFGLAKLAEPFGAAGTTPSPLSLSPTITSPAMMTGVGVLLGTAAYMAPEQAKGRLADKRSDIWAFGCVLYEMLTGKRAFEGEDVSDTLAAVLMREPDWNALPIATPPAIRALVKRCLARDRRQRIADLAAALFILEEVANIVPAAFVSVPAALEIPLWRRLAPYCVLALGATALSGAAVWFTVHQQPPRPTRLLIAQSNREAPLGVDPISRDLTITRDGTRVIYVGAGTPSQLFVRALDRLDGSPLSGLGQPRDPFPSTDGQWVGYFNGASLNKVAVTGGPPILIASSVDGTSRGATWTPDDTIIYATGSTSTGLQKVSASGGDPTVLTRPNRARGENDHLWPHVLPGGHAVLFTITTLGGGIDQSQIAVLDLRTGTQTTLIRAGSDAQYVASGHLIYTAGGSLRAVPFDLDRLTVTGAPVEVVSQVRSSIYGASDAIVSDDGTLVYRTGGAASLMRRLVWVDRAGKETPIAAPPRVYIYPRISPDGTRVALFVQDQQQDIWIWDLARQTLARFTLDPALDAQNAWTPDGRRLIFSSERFGSRNLFRQAADGTGAIERLTENPNLQNVTAVTPDGTRVIFGETMAKTGSDIMQMTLDGARRITPLVQTPFTDENAVVSPDGRWIAYNANDS